MRRAGSMIAAFAGSSHQVLISTPERTGWEGRPKRCHCGTM
eukprot:gene12803-12905_t